MDAGLWVRGALLGLAVAAPVGPIGVLVIRRSLAEGARLGFATGMGAAAADALYAVVASLGLAAGASSWSSSFAFRIASSAILAWLGFRALRKRSEEPREAAAPTTSSYGRAFGSTVALTIANPATIVSFAAASAALGAAPGSGALPAITFASSVLCGSATWWLALSLGTSLLRARLGPRVRRGIDLASAGMLLAFAIVALVR